MLFSALIPKLWWMHCTLGMPVVPLEKGSITLCCGSNGSYEKSFTLCFAAISLAIGTRVSHKCLSKSVAPQTVDETYLRSWRWSSGEPLPMVYT